MTSPTELVLKLAETNRYRIACKNTKGKYKEMKTEIRTVMAPKEKTFWVADDGTAFENKFECEDYELIVYRNRLGDSKDVVECKDADGFAPFDGGEHYEEHRYRWFKPLNERGIELLNKAFPADPAALSNGDIGKWHCVEYSDPDCGCWWGELSCSQNYAERLLKLLDPGQHDRSGYVTEMCPNCDTEVEMVWDTEKFGYRAFCPHCGKRLMLCDECLHSGGVYDDNCDYCTKTDSCRFNRNERN